MGLSAISGVAGALLSRLESLGSKATKASTPTPQPSSTHDASSVSDPGMFFNQLQALSQQNPTEFKKITAQVSQQLQSASSTSPSAALNQMASNFQNASKTGSFSDLFTHSPQTTASQPGSTPAAAAHPHHLYANANGTSDPSTITGIFSRALSQIKTDLGTTA